MSGILGQLLSVLLGELTKTADHEERASYASCRASS